METGRRFLKSPPQEFRRPGAAKSNVIRFWGGFADPKNTSQAASVGALRLRAAARSPIKKRDLKSPFF